jgi:hypothetical protein
MLYGGPNMHTRLGYPAMAQLAILLARRAPGLVRRRQACESGIPTLLYFELAKQCHGLLRDAAGGRSTIRGSAGEDLDHLDRVDCGGDESAYIAR